MSGPDTYHGYIPQTEGEWLAALVAEVRGMRADFSDFREETERRVRSLEDTRTEHRFFGRMVKIGFVAAAPVAGLAGWIGAHLK